MDILPTQVYDDEEFMPTQRIPLPVQDEAIRQVGSLVIGSKMYPINRGINRIGRHIACDVSINDQTVSKQHAEIEASSAHVSAWICDLNSSNKTKLNNLVLRAGRCYELKDGSTIEFGRVHATYKAHHSMDESMVPETPAAQRQKNVHPIIPGTPDSSLNNSSALEGDLSAVPGTQGDGEDSVFRRPSLYHQRLSTCSGKRSYGRDSSLDSSVENSRNSSAQQKGNADEVEKRVSISDMETQKSFGSEIDIHDVETQRISLGGLKNLMPTGKGYPRQTDIHDVETQQNQIDIHDVETQPPVQDIHTIQTPKIERNVQDVRGKGTAENVGVSRKLETKETDESRRQSDISDLETQRIVDVRSKTPVKEMQMRDSGDTFGGSAADNAAEASGIARSSETTTALSQNADASSQEFLKLSLTPNFDLDCSEFERSVDLLGSQNLLEGLDNNVITSPDGEQSKTSTPTKTSQVQAGNEPVDKSTDDENMFDAATQKNNDDGNVFSAVTKRVNYQLRGSLLEDDSETDEEGVFQRYFRDGDEKDLKKCPIERTVDSENSDTDEEGRFTEVAMKEKRNASVSLEVERSEKKGAKDDSSTSCDSDDVFDAPTQRINPTLDKSNDVSNVSLKKDKIDTDRTISDKGTLAQEPRRGVGSKDVVSDISSEIDDTAPTQVIRLSRSPSSSGSLFIAISEENSPSEKDTADMGDLPTQIIDESKSRTCTANDESSRTSERSKSNSGGYSPEDIDYEMAPTQLITDMEAKRTNVSAVLTNNNDAGTSGKKPSLDDTLERNLNEMFDDVNDESTPEPPQISTQSLKDVLQQSQVSNESGIDETDTDSNPPTKAVKKSMRVPKGKETPTVQSDRRTRRSNVKSKHVDVESQKTQESRNEATISDPEESLQKPENSSTQKSKILSRRNIATKTRRTSLSNSIGEGKNAELVAQKSNPPAEETPASVEQFQHSYDNETYDKETDDINVVDDSDDDILAGLPEVKISGTLSNPASPTSSMRSLRRFARNEMSYKRAAGKKAVKKASASKGKLPRKVNSWKSSETGEPYRPISSAQSMNFAKNKSSSFSGTLEADKVSAEENDNEDTNESNRSKNMGPTTRRTFAGELRGSSAARKVTISQQKSTSSIESSKVDNKRHSLGRPAKNTTVRNNKQTSPAEVESDDRSSVFQVTQEALPQNVTSRATERKSMIVSRTGKRSLNTDNENEQMEVKKRKAENTNKNVVATTRSRRSTAKAAAAGKKQSANILDFLTKANSPASTRNSQEAKTGDEDQLFSQRAVVNVVRISSDARRDSADSNDTEYEIKSNRHNGVHNEASRSNVDVSTDKNTNQNIKSQRETHRGRNTRQLLRSKDVSLDVGDESQEIEMIMKNALMSDESSSGRMENKNTAKGTKGAKTRSTRKRQNTTANTEVNSAKNTASSDVNEHDDAHFEVPVKKAKRTRASKNPQPELRKPPEKVSRINEPRTRSTRSSQKSATDSSTGDSAGENTQEAPKKGVPKQKGRANNKKKSLTSIHTDRSTSSGLDSSIDVASVLLTPSRKHRSTSSLNATLSPHKTPKILFTGITCDVYNNALVKLGAWKVNLLEHGCTVVVTDKIRRTVKFLCALAQGIPIVSVAWITDSEQAGYFVDMRNYILKDPSTEAKFGFRLRGSLEKAKRGKFLEGYTLVLTPSVGPPSIPELKTIITACGAKTLESPPSKWPEKVVIMSRNEDLECARTFLRSAPKTVTVQSPEFLLTGILRQEADLVKHKLL